MCVLRIIKDLKLQPEIYIHILPWLHEPILQVHAADQPHNVLSQIQPSSSRSHVGKVSVELRQFG